ncbi:MAG: InlB B-repeat-containing protein [Acholeplasma sp.]|nr:InlB B-repeat-containing protein [Acholeplasma sp.]
MKRIMLVMALLFFSFGLAACEDSTKKIITFETNQGTLIDAVTFEDVYTLDKLEKIQTTKEGYTFVSWHTEASLSDDSIVKETIESSVTLYAKWSINAYGINYHLNDGINASDNPVSYTIEDTISLKNPTREGYAFSGWYLEESFSNLITSIPKGSKQAIDLYAKWTELTDTSYEITWENEDGSVIKTTLVLEGELPVFEGELPTKAQTDTHTFAFLGWNPALSAATKDQTYVATFTMIPIKEENTYDKEALNLAVGFDVSAYLPEIFSTDYVILDESDDTGLVIYVDIFDWKVEDSDAFMAYIDQNLTYNDVEQSWVIGDYFIYVYEDTETYPGKTVYGFGIYDTTTAVTDKAPYDPTELNQFFGFDIYQQMPQLFTNNALFLDMSEGTIIEANIDVMDWTNQEALDYMDLLDTVLTYDEVEQSWIIGDYFLYVYEDDQTYPGQVIYGLGIYKDTSEVSEPVEGLYYAFNVQNTTSSLDSYKATIDQSIEFDGSDSKVIVKVSHLGNIATGMTPPGGLSNGLIFAANVKGIDNAKAYIEIDTLGTVIPEFSFEIEARDNFSSKLIGAKLQIHNGTEWVDFASGDFYSQITTDVVKITISNLNASKFRLLFTGTGEASNGGQFKLYNIELLQAKAKPIESWADMITLLGTNLNEGTLSNLLPELEGVSELYLNKISGYEYKISGLFAHDDYQTRVTNYLDSLVLKGYAINEALSALKGQTVYSISLNDDLAYGIYLLSDGQTVELRIWKYDPVIAIAELESLSKVQSINAFEKESFGKSGLPSTGKYNVLVVPVEIQGSPFPSDYETNLDIVFNGTSVQTGWESVSSFYYKSSYSNLDLTFDISPKYTTSNPASFYEGFSDEGDQYAIKEALLNLDPTIDFSQYDSNSDGLIDSVIFIYSKAYSDSDPWWAWVYAAQYGQANDLPLLDGKRFEYYFWASYDFMNDPLTGLSDLSYNAETYIHELGHLMGMPDLYPYNDALNYGPVGGFDMMDNNAGDHGPFNKLVFGWLQPLLAVEGSYQVTLDAYATDNDGLNNTLLIPYNANDLADGEAFDEYLLVMFYTPQGLYNGHLGLPHTLKDAGVMIYHIDARLNTGAGFWEEYFKNNNDSTSNFFVELLEADFNNSIPSKTNYISQSDILTNGVIDLSTYKWNQGGNINVSIEIAESFNNTSSSITLNVQVQ